LGAPSVAGGSSAAASALPYARHARRRSRGGQGWHGHGRRRFDLKPDGRADPPARRGHLREQLAVVAAQLDEHGDHGKRRGGGRARAAARTPSLRCRGGAVRRRARRRT
jgi:hypothetical protein